jgi:hypothetical protein
MHVDQAIFTSARGTQGSGYQLVARSRGIDDETAMMLRDWGPSQGALLTKDIDARAFSYYTLGPDRIVVSRTIYGGPEYSKRGELGVFTRSLIVSRRTLECYDNNPWWLAKTILTLGYFRLMRRSEPWLAEVDIPERSLIGIRSKATPQIANVVLEQILQSLQLNRPVAVIGNLNVDLTLRQIMSCLGQQRTQVSFTTGMVPSVRRPFQLHLFPHASPTLNSRLLKLGISPIEC